MSTFLGASLRAIGALKQKTSAELRQGFSPQHPKPVVNGASSSSSTLPFAGAAASSSSVGMLGGFKSPATINAFFPVQSRSNAPSTPSIAAPSSGSSRATSLVSSTKNLADDFLCDGWNDGEAAAAAKKARATAAEQQQQQQPDDDDVVILDSSPAAAPKAASLHLNGQQPSFPL